MTSTRQVNIATALKRAGSTGLRDMRSEAKKRIRTVKNLKAKAVAKSLHMQRPTRVHAGAPAAWALNVEGGVVRVSAYAHRQGKVGVSVAVNKGKRTIIKHAFVATMKSGHKGVYVRAETANGAQPRNRRRRSNLVGRLPINEPIASRPVDALRRPGQAQAVGERGVQAFLATFARLGPAKYELLPAAATVRIE